VRTRISEDTPVGTLIDGVVAARVMAKGASIVPAGAAVRGRLRRLERYTSPIPHFVVGVEFTEVEVEGIRRIFFADLVEISPTPNIEQTLTIRKSTMSQNADTTKQTEERLSLYDLPGVGTFFFKGVKLDLPEDFRTVWKTRPLKP
jgi:hypothetical protein